VTVRFRVLGPVGLLGADGSPLPLAGGRQGALLAALLARAGEVVSVDRLVHLLWGEALPDNPAGALHNQVARLRRALRAAGGDGRELVTRAPGYLLAAQPAEVAAGYLEAVYEADVAALLPRVRAPALVLHYRGDRVIPFRGGQQLAAALPAATFLPLDGAYHLPDAADLDRVVEAVAGFLGA
jgi:pimeloyl-ACP methyl ester carboxylesterase